MSQRPPHPHFIMHGIIYMNQCDFYQTCGNNGEMQLSFAFLHATTLWNKNKTAPLFLFVGYINININY